VPRLLIDIDDLAPGGEGVGRSDGRPVFVPFTAPGDRVVVDAPDGDGPAHAVLVSVERPGPVREAPPCPHFGPAGDLCGGCEWLHAGYLAQLSAKERGLRETLRRIARLDPGGYEARPIVASPRALRYRSRAKLHLDRASGRLAFFRRRSHEPVPLRECHLLEPGLDALREALGPALVRARLAPREVALEWSARAGRGAALLVLGDVTPAVRARAEGLLADVPALAGLVLRAEGGAPERVGEPVLLHDRDPEDPAAGVARSRPDVFQQANRGANARLVAAALDLLAPAGAHVLELHCGAGNFTAPLAARARSVSAVEVQGPALELARADLAGAGNVRLFAGDALALTRAFARERGPEARRFDAVLLDPPREGAKGLGPALRDLAAPRAVYVSCDPATFARDLRGCVEAGYRVAAVQAVDLFPQTHHVEAIGLLVRG
jgi:23S rRNA (uracil1939-C5)-methyltransferase